MCRLYKSLNISVLGAIGEKNYENRVEGMNIPCEGSQPPT